MTEGRTDPFPDDVVAAIRGHMNRDHLEDSLLICQVLGGQPTAVHARVEGVDRDGVDFVTMVDGCESVLRMNWSQRLVQRAQVRAELVRMVDDARRTAGIVEEPRPEH